MKVRVRIRFGVRVRVRIMITLDDDSCFICSVLTLAVAPSRTVPWGA